MVTYLAIAAVMSAQGQIMAGPAFEAFAARADRVCPRRDLRVITPGDLSWEQESFEPRLTAVRRRRLDAVDGRDPQCARSEGGLACPTTRRLDAMARTGLLPSFVRFACRQRPPAAAVRGATAASGGPAAPRRSGR